MARWLLKTGVTWKEFAELSRGVFLEVAEAEFGLRGRPTNVSRIALLTGMTRREVRRYRETAQPLRVDRRAEDDLNHASRVLAAWHLDAEFIDELGRPRVLAAEGEGGTFARLVRRYAGANRAPRLGRFSVPAAFLAAQTGLSGRNGRMMISGIAGISPDMSV